LSARGNPISGNPLAFAVQTEGERSGGDFVHFLIPGALLLVVLATVLAFLGYALWPRPPITASSTQHRTATPRLSA